MHLTVNITHPAHTGLTQLADNTELKRNNILHLLLIKIDRILNLRLFTG